MGVDTDALERGRSCYAGRAWLDAFDALNAADRAASLGPDELELLAMSAYMLEPGDALPWLRSALAVWQHLDAPYEAARLRALVGLGCRGDKDGADLEREAAYDTYVRLGAAPDADRLAGLLPLDLPRGARDLTARELDVLRLAAEGKRNRDIAADLVLSEHTVARHLQKHLRQARCLVAHGRDRICVPASPRVSAAHGEE